MKKRFIEEAPAEGMEVEAEEVAEVVEDVQDTTDEIIPEDAPEEPSCRTPCLP